MSGDTGKRERCLVAVLASALALPTCCIPSFAKDDAVNQGTIVMARASSGALTCEIRKDESNGAAALSGFIASSTDTAGSFRFLVVKSGSSGSSNVDQGQNFTLAAGKDMRAGQVTMNLEAGAQITVELTATAGDGAACHAKAMLGG
jgi:hypothetical protein